MTIAYTDRIRSVAVCAPPRRGQLDAGDCLGHSVRGAKRLANIKGSDDCHV